MKNRAIILYLLLAASIADAQQLGHYLQGSTGLGSGAAPPPGIYVTYLPYLWRITSVRGPSGGTVANASLNVWANMANITFIVPDKYYDVEFGFSVVAPWMSQRIQANILPTDKRVTGYSDTFVTPFLFGWHKGTANFLGSYSFVAPTGNFNPQSAANPGLGMWTHMFQAGTTVGFGSTKMWNASVMGTGELHSKRQGVDLTVGPGLTIEYGVGRHFLKGLVNVGASGHYYQKLIADSGTAVGPLLTGLKDRAFGLGPELQWIFPKAKLAFVFRYQPQFQVRNRVRGDIFVINLTYLGTFRP